MKAMIFAAGLGSRLGEITARIPKAMVEVGGEPMLKRVILKIKETGVSTIVINVHHFASQIEDYLKKNDNFGADIHISDERSLLLDTGGGLLKARHLLEGNEPILIHNVDILTDFDINRMLAVHESTKADATLLVDERKTSRYLLFNREMRMTGWKNIKDGEIKSPWDNSIIQTSHPLAFGGVHIVSPKLFLPLSSYSSNYVFSITPFYTDMCASLNIMGYRPDETYEWHDIGKPESLSKAQNIVSKLRQKFREEF